MRSLIIFLNAIVLIALSACTTTQSAQDTQVTADASTVEPTRSYVTIGDAANFDASHGTVFITGSNRGIGLEYVKQLSAAGWNIIATARKPNAATELQAIAANNPRLVIEELDVTDFARIDALAAKYAAQPFDVLLSNAGIVPRYKSAFAKVDGVDWDMARRSYEVNAMAPLKLAQTFMPNVAASTQKKIVIISSKAGSFELSPKMPMMYSYRASKAALNMYMSSLSFETGRKDIIVTMISPGMVATTPGFKMKGQIQPEESVDKMLRVIDGLSAENNGQFLDYSDGHVLGW